MCCCAYYRHDANKQTHTHICSHSSTHTEQTSTQHTPEERKKSQWNKTNATRKMKICLFFVSFFFVVVIFARFFLQLLLKMKTTELETVQCKCDDRSMLQKTTTSQNTRSESYCTLWHFSPCATEQAPIGSRQ